MNSEKKTKNVIRRIIICTLVLLAGGIGMQLLAAFKKPPVEVAVSEKALKVEAVSITPVDMSVTLKGFGELSVLNKVTISPEVGGKIIRIHPRLEVGEIISEKELLFEIDAKDRKAALAMAEASVAQQEEMILRLEKQFENDRDRLKTIERNKELAFTEFERVKRLFEQNKVGAKSGVDAAEKGYNTAKDNFDQLTHALALYPIQIREAESGLLSRKASRDQAVNDLSKCIVTAPFTGRLTKVSIENNQYVASGQTVLEMADDSVLEVKVPLDGSEAEKWLMFGDGGEKGNWFGKPLPVECAVAWTGDDSGKFWKGTLHRVVAFDSNTRTLTVAVRVRPDENKGASFPPVDGMFASVSIPGKVMKNVFRLPHYAVSFEKTVYVASDNRLTTVPVHVERTEDGFTYVSEGLKTGDLVIVTRLVDPLENTLLELDMKKGGDEKS